MTEPQPPLVLALITADAVTRDFGTGKISVLGIYSAIGAQGFPWAQPSLLIYGALTDGRPGKTPGRLRLVDVDEERPPVFETNLEVEFSDPFVVVEFVIAYRDVVFPEPGEYRLQLYGAGAPLLERRIQITPVDQPPEQGE